MFWEPQGGSTKGCAGCGVLSAKALRCRSSKETRSSGWDKAGVPRGGHQSGSRGLDCRGWWAEQQPGCLQGEAGPPAFGFMLRTGCPRREGLSWGGQLDTWDPREGRGLRPRAHLGEFWDRWRVRVSRWEREGCGGVG